MATIHSILNDLETLLASLKLKLNDMPVAEVVVYAEPVDPDDDLTLAQLLAKKKNLPLVQVKKEVDDPDDDLTLAQLLAKKKNLPLVQVKKEVDWTQLPDELLTYIGSFIDIGKQDAQRRYDIVNAKYTAEKIPYHIDLWKPYAKITSKLVKLNEDITLWSKRERRDIKQIKQDDPNIANYFAMVRDDKYEKRLKLMRILYRNKYWRGVQPFMDLNGEVVQFHQDEDYWREMRKYGEYNGPLNAKAGYYDL